jgi:hypothetical protein
MRLLDGACGRVASESVRAHDDDNESITSHVAFSCVAAPRWEHASIIHADMARGAASGYTTIVASATSSSSIAISISPCST